MMNAILFAVVRFFETVVNFALGAVLLGLGAVGVVAASQWLVSRPHSDRSFGQIGTSRRGFSSLRLATALLAIGVACLIVGTAFRLR